MYKNKEFKRYSKNLHNLLLKILHDDLDDPIFRRITVNYVKLSRNKSSATVYLDLGSVSNPDLVLYKLNKLNYLFRKKLLEYMARFRVPYLRFVKDNILDMGIRVERLISEGISDITESEISYKATLETAEEEDKYNA